MNRFVSYILLLSVIFLGSALFAQQGNEGGIYLDKNTHFIISTKTQVVTPANVNIHSSITGEGQLKINGKENSVIDAHHHKINNVSMYKTGDAQLTIASGLRIGQSLNLESGTLVLTDFNILLDEDASLLVSTLARIQFLGKGNILRAAPTHLNAYSPPVLDLKQLMVLDYESLQPPFFTRLTFKENTKNIRNYNHKPPTPPA